ncbi:hypothetical protein BD626DRAFT_491519 [Schizophyllum amplum]|uniref:Uncharacterized protein n=1 Tax=Schizophyllum amplum TaxID=97359 RepID=A0A550CHV6_9AGAR|nr:hypothetical protein BD626DRAFT_491519 [Auriculariopsis ampla]
MPFDALSEPDSDAPEQLYSAHPRFTIPTLTFHKQPPYNFPSHHHLCSAAYCYYPNSPKPVEGKFDCLGKTWCGRKCRGWYEVSLEQAVANDKYYQRQLAAEEKRRHRPKDPLEADSVLREKVYVNAWARMQKKQVQAPGMQGRRAEDERERMSREAEEIARMQMERAGCCIPGLAEMAQAIVRPLSPASLRVRSRSRRRKNPAPMAEVPPVPPLPAMIPPQRTSSLPPAPPPARPIPPIPHAMSPVPSDSLVSSAGHYFAPSVRRTSHSQTVMIEQDSRPTSPTHSFHRSASPISSYGVPVSRVVHLRRASGSVSPGRAASPTARIPSFDANAGPAWPPRSLSPSTRPSTSHSTRPTTSHSSTQPTTYSTHATGSTRATTPSPHRPPPTCVPKDVHQDGHSSGTCPSRAVTMTSTFDISLPSAAVSRKSRKSAPRRLSASTTPSNPESHWSRLEHATSPVRMQPPPLPFTETPTPAQCYAAMYKARCA